MLQSHPHAPMLFLCDCGGGCAGDKEAAAEASTDLRLLAIQVCGGSSMRLQGTLSDRCYRMLSEARLLAPFCAVREHPSLICVYIAGGLCMPDRLVLVALQESVVGKGEPMLVGPYALPPLELIRSLVDLSDTPTPSLEAVQSSLSGAQGAAELEVGGVLKGPKALQKAFDALAVAGPDRLLRSSPEDATAVHEELTGVLARVWQRAAAADDWMELGQQMREQGWSSDQYTSAVQRTLLFYGASKLYKPKKPSSGLSDLPAASRTFEGVFPIFGGMSPSSQGDNRIAESVEQVLQANPAFAAAGDMMLESMQLACESNLMACH